jgi:hypothetical protein
MKNLNMNQQNVKLFFKAKTSFTVVTMLFIFLCTNAVMAQTPTWSGQGNGELLDRWTINDDNSNHWSQLRLQVGNAYGWNMLNEGTLKWSYDASGTHSSLGHRKMSLTNDGKLGIGDVDPLIHLAIGDSDTGFNQNGDGELGFYTNNGERMRIDKDGNVGIGTNNPTETFHVNGSMRVQNDFVIDQDKNMKSIGIVNIQADYDNSGDGDINFKAGNDVRMKILDNGNVGIGLTNPSYELDVDGTARADEVITSSVSFPDYVFADDYKVLPLEELEQYVKKYKHLPNMPAEAEVVKNGLHVTDILTRSVENIETLYLHMIALQKEMQQLKKDNAALRSELRRARH